MANHCQDFISAKDTRPFFLYFCTSDPHRGGGIVVDSPHKPDRFGNKAEGYPGVKEVKYDPAEVLVHNFLRIHQPVGLNWLSIINLSAE